MSCNWPDSKSVQTAIEFSEITMSFRQRVHVTNGGYASPPLACQEHTLRTKDAGHLSDESRIITDLHEIALSNDNGDSYRA